MAHCSDEMKALWIAELKKHGVEEVTMKVNKTIVEKLEFPPGETVHFGDADTWLTLCGTGWIHASNDPAHVTCMECLAILEQRETAVSQETP